MIAIDSSSLRRLFDGIFDRDTVRAAEAIRNREAAIAPVVIAELLSDPQLEPGFVTDLDALFVLPIIDGFWHRAGRLRAATLRLASGTRLPDTLIAQFCLDYDLPLVTYDAGFRRFIPAGLKLLGREV